MRSCLVIGDGCWRNSYTNKWLYNGYTVISIANVNAIEAAVHTRVPIEAWLTGQGYLTRD